MKSLFISISVLFHVHLSAQPVALEGPEVIKKFLEQRDKNYSHFPLVHHVILTEQESLMSGEKLYSNRAEIEYLRDGYHDMENDRMKLIQGKNEIHIDSLFEEHLYGGLAEIKKDVVKYPREFLDLNKKYYQYEVVQMAGDPMIYQVSFTPSNSKAKYEGSLYIQASDFALVRAEYKLSPFGIDLLNRIQTDSEFMWSDIHETIEYKKPENIRHYLDDDDMYYLSTIKTKGRGHHHDWKEDLTLDTELLVFETNRTRFFANEYYRIDDNIALSQLDYAYSTAGQNMEGKSISHSQMVAQESSGTGDIEVQLTKKEQD